MRTPLPAVHPGEILAEEFMVPHNLSANALGLALHVPANRISEIIRGKRGITAETALRLARYFNTSPAFWLNLQAKYDLEIAKDELGPRIEREVPPRDETERPSRLANGD